MSGEQLVPIIEAAHEGHSSLEKLDLSINRIGNGGCDALATLLRDPTSNLRIIILEVMLFIMLEQLPLQMLY